MFASCCVSEVSSAYWACGAKDMRKDNKTVCQGWGSIRSAQFTCRSHFLICSVCCSQGRVHPEDASGEKERKQNQWVRNSASERSRVQSQTPQLACFLLACKVIVSCSLPPAHAVPVPTPPFSLCRVGNSRSCRLSSGTARRDFYTRLSSSWNFYHHPSFNPGNRAKVFK